MSVFPPKDILLGVGFAPQDIFEIDGPWPATVVLMRENTGQLHRAFEGFFDIFLPTRAVTLHEMTGGYRRRKFHYKNGMAGFNPPQAKWTIQWEGILEGLAIVIDRSTMEKASLQLFDEPFDSLTWRMALCDRAPAIAYLGLDIANQAATGFPAGKGHVATQLQAFLAMVIRRYATTPSRDTAIVGVSSRQVLRAVNYIEANLSQALTLQHICDASAASLGHLNRLFRIELGHSVWRYVMHRRLNAAALKLVQSDDTIENVAKLYGFQSRSNFSRQFKEFHKNSPGAYRMQNRKLD